MIDLPNLYKQNQKMKLKTPERPNFSRYAKLCDNTFYLDPQPYQRPYTEDVIIEQQPKRKQSTIAFTSVSREKRGNFRFSIKLPVGQFTQYPNHFVGKSRTPSWSFSKTEKYEKIPLVQFEVCERHPIIVENQQVKMKASATSMRQFMKDKVKVNHSTSFFSTKEKIGNQSMRDTKPSRNYSIIQPQQTSQVGFFAQTKIQQPRYLSKQDLNNVQGYLDQKHYLKRITPCPNGYVEFHKRRARNPNRNSKGFETYLYAYNHEKQFNNFAKTAYPTCPVGHVHMDKHLERPDYTPDRLGPNTEPFSIDKTRVAKNKIDLNLQLFRSKITTKYDRVGAEPNTRLSYDVEPQELPGMLQMDRMLGRNPELFPIVDPAIKKAGDIEMKEDLRMCIPIKEINEALRHKNVENYTKIVKEGL